MESSLQKERQFYDVRWQTSDIGPKELRRVDSTLAAIPQDCRTVLDVGCGDGLVSHRITTDLHKSVVAVDLSLTALRRVNGSRCCASAHQLPFPDRTFDLVMMTEILEHIPEELYQSVLQELARASARYVLITVPNSENLHENTARCAKCGSRFHLWGHLRSYTPEKLKFMLPGFEAVTLRAFGDSYPAYHPGLLWIKQRVAGEWCWEAGRTSCFECGSTAAPVPRLPFVSRVCDSINYRTWGKRHLIESWLLALYRRSGTDNSTPDAQVRR